MKNILLVLLAGVVFAGTIGCGKKKKPEFLLVGVFHNIPDSLSCNWDAAYKKIAGYHPDQMAIEWVSPADTASLPQQFGDNYQHVYDSLAMALHGKKINIADSISYYQKLLAKKNDEKLRSHLWGYYYLGLNTGNRDLQTYLIHKWMEKTGEVPDTSTLMTHVFWKRYKQMIADRKDNEFFRLVFPLADQLGIQYLQPTDHRKTFVEQSGAWMRFYEAVEGKPLGRKVDSLWKLFVAEEKKQLASCNGLLFVNSQEALKNSDHIQAHIADDSNIKDYSDYTAVWYKRNKMIAENIIESANNSGAKKMAVFYGYMHIYPVKKFLEEKGYNVKLLADLQ